MSCTAVVGGQFGSEGKGKVATLLAARSTEPWIVRCGGPNSGHSTSINGEEVVLRQLPSAIGHPQSTALIPAGAVVDQHVLVQEMERFQVVRDRVFVDPRAILLLDADRNWEEAHLDHISSTCSGTGSAEIRRLARSSTLILAGASTLLRERARVEQVAPLLHRHLDAGGDAILEGTQGFGLSLLHGFEYPFVTSRDTTAAGLASAVGLSPRQIDGIVLVLRTFPIRTGFNGPLRHETTWNEVQRISGATQVTRESASVTKRPRRVAHFDLDAVKLACLYNRPTALAIMGIDRLDDRNRGVKDCSLLTQTATDFLESVQSETNVRIMMVGTGFRSDEAIWMPSFTKDPHA